MSEKQNKRTGYNSNLARLVAKVVKPVMRKRGFYDVDIISDWSHIVGPEWANLSIPKKLSFNPKTRRSGTLHIQVSPGSSVLMQHIEPQIIDRVNTYFGFEAVKKLRLIHGYIPEPQTETPEAKEKITVPLPEIEGIADQALKESLQRFGQTMKQKEQK